MELSICKRLARAFAILVSLIIVYATASLVPAYAGTYLFSPNEKLCMADAYLLEPGNSLAQNKLNCTANDVEITKVTPLDPNAECTPGQVFTFDADVTVRTNANERWDTTFYLPLTEASPQVVQGNVDNCSLLLPIPGDSGETADVDLDGDACGDITKALGPDEYTLTNESITMLCADEDGDNRADFTYCAAWDNQERDNCTIEEDPYSGQIPNTKSKCNCDTFNIDVFIKPAPPTITKTLVGTDTHSEPGGVYTFDVDFSNTNTQTSLFLTSLNDQVDIAADGSYDTSLNLWGALDVPAGEGVYLTASNCSQPANGGEITASGSYSCRFSVTIVDTDLPDDQSPELYDDVIQLSLIDKNSDPVTNGETCPADIAGTPGNFCSNKLQVKVTNLPPDIRVQKTADKDSVLEPGEDVLFTITVYNDSAVYDSPVVVTSLTDTIYGDLTQLGDCNTIGSIAFAGSASCSFTEFVAGNAGDSYTNIVTAIARDNEFDTDTATDSHTILVNDVPSNISLTKTPSVSSVLETGDDASIFRDVDFTFLFSVDPAGVDDVVFDGLTDTVFGDILAECIVDMLDGNPIAPVPLNGYTLSPGHNASCTITKGLQGDDADQHQDTATITGDDEDGQFVQAMASATVDFDPVAPAADMKFATSMLVVLEMHNAGIENVTLSSITLKGVDVADGAENGEFKILNSVGGDYNLISYPACNVGEVLGYNGSATDTYSCAFTIELKPGLENANDIAFSAPIGNGIIVTFTDNDLADTSNAVGIQVLTDEP